MQNVEAGMRASDRRGGREEEKQPVPPPSIYINYEGSSFSSSSPSSWDPPEEVYHATTKSRSLSVNISCGGDLYNNHVGGGDIVTIYLHSITLVARP